MILYTTTKELLEEAAALVKTEKAIIEYTDLQIKKYRFRCELAAICRKLIKVYNLVQILIYKNSLKYSDDIERFFIATESAFSLYIEFYFIFNNDIRFHIEFADHDGIFATSKHDLYGSETEYANNYISDNWVLGLIKNAIFFDKNGELQVWTKSIGTKPSAFSGKFMQSDYVDKFALAVEYLRNLDLDTLVSDYIKCNFSSGNYAAFEIKIEQPNAEIKVIETAKTNSLIKNNE